MPFATRPVWLVALIVSFLCGMLDASGVPRSGPAFSRQAADATTRTQAVAVEPIGTSRDGMPRQTACGGASPVAGEPVLEGSTAGLRPSHPVSGLNAPRFSLRI